CATDRSVFLVQDADGAGGEQEVDDAALVGAGDGMGIVVQYRRDDAGGAVGRCGDHAPTGGVFLVHCQSPEVDPVEPAQRIFHVAALEAAQLARQDRSATAYLETARQDALRAATALA